MFCVRFVSASTEWERNFSIIGNESAYGITQSSDGGYVVAGDSDIPDNNVYQAWLVKIDSSGDSVWNQTYTGLGDVELFSVAPTSDGGYVISGYVSYTNDSENYALLMKADSQGNLEWNQTYGNPGDNRAFSAIQTSDGGYVFAGYTNTAGSGNEDFWLVKTDSQGNMLWNQTYGGAGTDEAFSVIQTSDNGYAIAGQTNSFGNGENDAWLVNTDSSGQMNWNQTFGFSSDDGAYSVIQTSDGGYALAGYSYSNAQDQYNPWLVKTDSTGNMEWQQTYQTGGDAQALSLVQTDDNGYALAGYTNSYGPEGSQIWFSKIDSNGKSQWSQTLGGTGDDGAFGVTKSSNDSYVIAGYTDSQGSDLSNVVIAQIDQASSKSSAISSFELILVTVFGVLAAVSISVLVYRRKIKKS